MNKIKLPTRRINLVLLLLSLYFSVFANSNRYVGDFSHNEIEQRLAALSADIDFKLNADVKRYLDQFVVHYKHSSEQLIGRSMYYFPLIEEMIAKTKIPSEIKNLVIIESSLNPNARSRVGATGLWQFMRSTGRMYGLKIDNIVDERRDPEKSTEAALTYLSDLYERFGDWTLALAAYNCGPGNVRKAMRRSGGTDYWSIRHYLPRETRNYIPKFIAATYMMNYYSDHDINPKYPEELHEKTRKATLHDKTSFLEISSLTGLDVETIAWYNPEYIGKYIPKSEQGKELSLPESEMLSFLEKMNALHLLVPDPLEVLNEETRVASQLLERRMQLPEIEALKGIDGLLANLELRHTEEFLLRPELKLHNSKYQILYIDPRKDVSKRNTRENVQDENDKKLFVFRRK